MPMDIKRLLTPPSPVRAVPAARREPPAAPPVRPAALSLLAEAAPPLPVLELPAGKS